MPMQPAYAYAARLCLCSPPMPMQPTYTTCSAWAVSALDRQVPPPVAYSGQPCRHARRLAAGSRCPASPPPPGGTHAATRRTHAATRRTHAATRRTQVGAAFFHVDTQRHSISGFDLAELSMIFTTVPPPAADAAADADAVAADAAADAADDDDSGGGAGIHFNSGVLQRVGLLFFVGIYFVLTTLVTLGMWHQERLLYFQACRPSAFEAAALCVRGAAMRWVSQGCAALCSLRVGRVLRVQECTACSTHYGHALTLTAGVGGRLLRRLHLPRFEALLRRRAAAPTPRAARRLAHLSDERFAPRRARLVAPYLALARPRRSGDVRRGTLSRQHRRGHDELRAGDRVSLQRCRAAAARHAHLTHHAHHAHLTRHARHTHTTLRSEEEVTNTHPDTPHTRSHTHRT